MKSSALAPLLFLACAAPVLAHSLFLEFRGAFLEPGALSSVALVNGEFGRSDNVITRDRMLDVRIVGPTEEGLTRPTPDDWREEGERTVLDFVTGDPGTYVVGVSTADRTIDLAGEDFDEYLRHDGVADVLEARRRAGAIGQDARERYSKHVKALFQVGSTRTGAWASRFDYPLELVPLENPYDLSAGDAFPLRLLAAGVPVADHPLYASFEGHHAHDDSGGHVEAFTGRTDAEGVVTVPLSRAGRWYARTIRMLPGGEEDDFDYDSEWTTLTWDVREVPAGSSARAIVAGGLVLLTAALLLRARRRRS